MVFGARSVWPTRCLPLTSHEFHCACFGYIKLYAYVAVSFCQIQKPSSSSSPDHGRFPQPYVRGRCVLGPGSSLKGRSPGRKGLSIQFPTQPSYSGFWGESEIPVCGDSLSLPGWRSAPLGPRVARVTSVSLVPRALRQEVAFTRTLRYHSRARAGAGRRPEHPPPGTAGPFWSQTPWPPGRVGPWKLPTRVWTEGRAQRPGRAQAGRLRPQRPWPGP